MNWLNLVDKPFIFEGKRYNNGKELLENTSLDGKILELEIIYESKIYEFQIRDYMLKAPTVNFDFHSRYNNNTYPRFPKLHGTIEEETEKLIYINTPSWKGWLPKDAVTQKEIDNGYKSI